MWPVAPAAARPIDAPVAPRACAARPCRLGRFAPRCRGANAGTGLGPAAVGRVLSWRRRALPLSRLLSRRLGHRRSESTARARRLTARDPRSCHRLGSAGRHSAHRSGCKLAGTGPSAAIVGSRLGLETAMGPMALFALSIACSVMIAVSDTDHHGRRQPLRRGTRLAEAAIAGGASRSGFRRLCRGFTLQSAA